MYFMTVRFNIYKISEVCVICFLFPDKEPGTEKLSNLLWVTLLLNCRIMQFEPRSLIFNLMPFPLHNAPFYLPISFSKYPLIVWVNQEKIYKLTSMKGISELWVKS